MIPMKRITGLVFLCLVAAGVNLSLRGQGSDILVEDAPADPAQIAQINRLIKVTNLGELMTEKFMNGMEEGMKEMGEGGNGLPKEFRTEFFQKFSERFDADAFINQVIVPVLATNFTTEELTMVADLLESDLGNKLLTSKLNGEELDIQAMLDSGEISEEDGMKLMQVFLRLGKKSLLEDGTLSKEIETRATAYGQNLAMEIVTTMMETYAKGGMEEAAE